MLGEGIEQLAVFCVFAAVGVFVSAAYALGYRLTKSRLAAVIFDLFFGVIAIAAVIFVNLKINNGEFRVFIFVGFALGVIITQITLKTMLDNIASALYNLFTDIGADKSHDEIISKQKIIDNNVDGVDSVDTVGMHAVDNAHSNGVAKPTRRKVARSYRSRKKRRGGKTKTA